MNIKSVSSSRVLQRPLEQQFTNKRLKTTAADLTQVTSSSTINSIEIDLKENVILDSLSNYLSALELRSIHPECENHLILCTLSLAFCLTKERPFREPEELMVKALLDNGKLSWRFYFSRNI